MVSNPVVERALESLTLVIALNHGAVDLVDPRDRALAHQHLEILRDGGENFIPHEIVSWARRNGWSAEAAAELGEIARSVKDGPRQRLPRKQARDNVLLEWRKSAASAAPHHSVASHHSVAAQRAADDAHSGGRPVQRGALPSEG